jgi:signal transduction histidine kinase
MDPLMLVATGAVVSVAAFLAGRALGFRTGLDTGRSAGEVAGAEAGRSDGLEEGRVLGSQEGRAAGFTEGKTAGYAEGRSAGRAEASAELEAKLEALVEALARGGLPAGDSGSVEGRLRAALERGWTPREAERQLALREAIERVSAFLHVSVRGPLEQLDAGCSFEELRAAVAQSLGAIEDLDFFLDQTQDVAAEGADLGQLAQSVAREFAADQEVGVRLSLGGTGIRAVVQPSPLMDALYLVLHNAARFGAGSTIDLAVESVGGRATLRVRDRGEGFTEEAFRRAFDPFYSTSDRGLGLGLPHARRVVENMGGTIELRNVPDGGAEVELSFPAA